MRRWGNFPMPITEMSLLGPFSTMQTAFAEKTLASSGTKRSVKLLRLPRGISPAVGDTEKGAATFHWNGAGRSPVLCTSNARSAASFTATYPNPISLGTAWMPSSGAWPTSTTEKLPCGSTNCTSSS